MEGTTIPIITAICLALGKVLKQSPMDSRWIPLICLLSGLTFGLVGFFAMPELHAGGLLQSLLMGASGGAAATGVHQVGKQSVSSEE